MKMFFNNKILSQEHLQTLRNLVLEAHSEPSQTSKMKSFKK